MEVPKNVQHQIAQFQQMQQQAQANNHAEAERGDADQRN